MTNLHSLSNGSRIRKKIQRVGRGPSSGRGKTSCRGQKGSKSRSGYKRRYGNEGGQFKLYLKIPVRGFTRGRFKKEMGHVNLFLLEKLFSDGEIVNRQTCIEKGILSRKNQAGFKILGQGELTKKVTIEANSYSEEAKKKLDANKISYKVVGL